MISTDDEMSRTEILSNDSVPDGFSRTSHSHSEREKSKGGHSVGVSSDDRFVDSNLHDPNLAKITTRDGKGRIDSGEGVDVSRFGESDDGVNEDVCLSISSGSNGQFSMSSMHGVSSLESDDSSPREFVEVSSEFSRGVCASSSARIPGRGSGGRTSKCYVVEMLRRLNSLNGSTDVEFPNVVVEVGDGRVSFVVRTKDGSSFVRFIGSVDVGDFTQSCQYPLHHHCGEEGTYR